MFKFNFFFSFFPMTKINFFFIAGNEKLTKRIKNVTTFHSSKINLLETYHLPIANDIIQIIIIDILARIVVDLNFRGKHMAYHRSTEINVNVSTETATDTVCNKVNVWVLQELCSVMQQKLTCELRWALCGNKFTYILTNCYFCSIKSVSLWKFGCQKLSA